MVAPGQLVWKRVRLLGGMVHSPDREKGVRRRLCENSLLSWQNNRDMARGYFL